MTRLVRALLLLAGAAFAAHAAGQAATYPTKPVRVIVPYPAGGGTDAVGRIVMQKLSTVFGQQFIIENRGGAATLTGTDAVAKATPDGYTLLYTASTIAINHTLLQKQLPYDTHRDLVPVGLAAFHPQILVTPPSVPFSTVAELVAYAKQQPGKLNYGTPGVGSPQHIETELLKSLTSTDILHVPYRGAGPAMQDLLGGRLTMMFVGLAPTLRHIRAGTLKVIAVDTSERVPLLPNVPSLVESGLKEFKIQTWSGLLAPAGTDPQIIARLSDAIGRIATDKDVRDKLINSGLVPAGMRSAAFADYFKQDIARYAEVIRKANITATE